MRIIKQLGGLSSTQSHAQIRISTCTHLDGLNTLSNLIDLIEIKPKMKTRSYLPSTGALCKHEYCDGFGFERNIAMSVVNNSRCLYTTINTLSISQLQASSGFRNG